MHKALCINTLRLFIKPLKTQKNFKETQRSTNELPIAML